MDVTGSTREDYNGTHGIYQRDLYYYFWSILLSSYFKRNRVGQPPQDSYMFWASFISI